jgi:OmcA/MtrC family decaheme c-type cytochrome
MFSTNRAVALALTAVSALAVSAYHRGGVRHETDSKPGPTYSSHQVEFYLDDDQVGYIRPGLRVEVDSVQIPADLRPVVELSFFDDFDQPLDREGKVTPGPISVSFILAWYDGETRQYTSYTSRIQESPDSGETAEQASSDSGGSWQDLELGRARYTFGTTLPADFDGSRTHSLAMYATRDLEDIIEKRYYDNPIVDFRPDGGDVAEVWDAVSDETCNSCHDQLALHGGTRRAVKLCVTCHSPQSTDPDTGNTVDMKVMIHKIHMGANLPSVQAGTPYQIVGYRQSVHDYSEVLFPQDVRNCTTCHREDSPEGHIWYTNPSRATCGSCHDDIDFEAGVGHPMQLDDQACAFCHVPEGEFEFDASIRGAHVIPAKSSQLAGLNLEILEVQDAHPGGTPTVTFTVTEDDGTFVDPSTLNRMSFLVGGPTTDYSDYFREDGSDATIIGETAVKTFETPIPEDATGTWAFSADVYRYVTIDDGSEEGIEVREAAFNPIFYAELTPAEAAVARREVVTLDKCNVCHDTLSLHGGQRFAIEECLICHNPVEDDSGRRPEEEFPAESVHFKWLIHRIHTGHELDDDFTVYGYGGTPHNYNHVGYPGDRRNCEACHEGGTYGVPLPEGSLDTPTPRDWYSPMRPAAAACLSCHSSVDAASHAWVNTAPFGESCAACHGDEREFSVARVHAR